MSERVRSILHENPLLSVVIGALLSAGLVWLTNGVTGGFELRAQVMLTAQQVQRLSETLDYHLKSDSVRRSEYEEIKRRVDLLEAAALRSK